MDAFITPDYYNGDRVRDYLDLISRYKFLEKKNVTDVLVRDIDKVCDIAQVSQDVKIAFSSSAVLKKSTQSVAIYEYPSDHGTSTTMDMRREYEISVRDIQKIVTVVSEGRTYPSLIHGMILPPAKRNIRDGQLKIAVDLVLAVDSMKLRPPRNEHYYNILAIGSASPGDVDKCGQAYNMLTVMGISAKVLMVDPYENARVVTVNTATSKIKFYREKRYYNYNEIDSINYDLILDDSWVHDVPRSSRDVDGKVYTAPNFSIKRFPWDNCEVGNNYIQQFYTVGGETRTVSRDLQYMRYSRHYSLGTCGACAELTYRLHHDYDLSFYDKFMSIHKKNCLTSKHNYQFNVNIKVDWYRIVSFEPDYSLYCSIKGYDQVYGTNVVRKFDDFSGLRMIFTSRLKVPVDAYDKCEYVLVIEDGDFYVNKMMDFVLELDQKIPNIGRHVTVDEVENYFEDNPLIVQENEFYAKVCRVIGDIAPPDVVVRYWKKIGKYKKLWDNEYAIREFSILFKKMIEGRVSEDTLVQDMDRRYVRFRSDHDKTLVNLNEEELTVMRKSVRFKE